MKLSKSKYCNAFQCMKMLWLMEYKPEEKMEIDNDSILETGKEVGEVAKALFGNYIDIPYQDLKKMIKETKEIIDNNDKCNITEASFSYQDNFCSVDILKKNNNHFEIYEVKSSTSIKEIYKEDISYQYYVLTSLGYLVDKAYVVHINKNYVKKGPLELDKLFQIEDLTSIAKQKRKDVEKKIVEINQYIKKEEEKDIVGKQCFDPYQCPFFNYCTRHLEKPNVFDLVGVNINQKLKFYRNKVTSFKDLLKEDISDKAKEQIDFEINKKEDKIEKKSLEEFLNTLTYPLYFLDFETYQQAIPQYDGIHPYDQIPFQYSLHYIEKENEEVKHKEFLATPGIDPRENLAKALIKDIPENVCVLAYNMGFEKKVIQNLAEQYPSLSKHLLNIRDNIKDLMIPFHNRVYYTKGMKGKYSIKYVLPALFPKDPSLNYHNLEEIHNGGEAMSAYANMHKLSKEEQQSLRKHLLKYCELDTYAMVKIYQKIKEKI